MKSTCAYLTSIPHQLLVLSSRLLSHRPAHVLSFSVLRSHNLSLNWGRSNFLGCHLLPITHTN
ncbi:hypothetical protein Sjap_007936 [Stephania japonica]|uniref:Uncharacterized protein n=1 Tax=Stephania japonica TaxID=461633 RepID=A0AAP0JQW7_9MAGN